MERLCGLLSFEIFHYGVAGTDLTTETILKYSFCKGTPEALSSLNYSVSMIF